MVFGEGGVVQGRIARRQPNKTAMQHVVARDGAQTDLAASTHVTVSRAESIFGLYRAIAILTGFYKRQLAHCLDSDLYEEVNFVTRVFQYLRQGIGHVLRGTAYWLGIVAKMRY